MSRTPAQSEAARLNGAKSIGPTSEAGKNSSSQNSIRHGLFAKPTLLPGEDLLEYRELHADYARSFCPKNRAEADAVGRIADVAWKLQRLADIENAMIHRRLDEHIQQSKLYRRQYHSRACLIAARGVAAAVAEIPARETICEMRYFSDGLEQLIEMLQMNEGFEPGLVAIIEVAEEKLTTDGNRIDPQAYRDLAPVLQKVEAALVEKLRLEEEQLEELKKEIAQTDLLLKGEDLNVLDKYRKSLDQATARQLEILKSTKSASVEPDGSPVKVDLRVVK